MNVERKMLGALLQMTVTLLDIYVCSLELFEGSDFQIMVQTHHKCLLLKDAVVISATQTEITWFGHKQKE